MTRRQDDLYIESYPGAGDTGLIPAFKQSGFSGGESGPYLEAPWTPTTAIYARNTALGTGSLIDNSTRYVGGSTFPITVQTVQFWGMVPTNWTASDGMYTVYEPSGTSGAFYIQYDPSSSGSTAGVWRIGRNITIASGYHEFTWLVPRGEWHHFTIVFENSALRFYVDGILEESNTARRWFASASEGNTSSGNQTTWVIAQGPGNTQRSGLPWMACVRAFSHAMDQTEVTATWNKVLWPGYTGMTFQAVGLDSDDHPETTILDNTCWGSHVQWTASGANLVLDQTPPVVFPSIIRQTARDVAQEEHVYNIDFNTWTTGAISQFPEGTFILASNSTAGASLGSITDPGGGNPKYWTSDPGTSKNLRMYLDPTVVDAWTSPFVAKGGLSVTTLQKDFYRSDHRNYTLIGGPRLHTSDSVFRLCVQDQIYLEGTANTSGSETLTSGNPGTGVTRAWYFYEVQLIPTVYMSDGQWTGTFRVRWWPEADGIGSPPGTWNLTYDIAANATHKRYPIGGVSQQFLTGKHFYDGVTQVIQPLFQWSFTRSANPNYPAYIKYIRLKTFSYTP